MNLPSKKSILKSVSTGLAELHDTNIIHTDIKPSNILIDYEEVSEGDPAVTQVRISDLEDSVLLPPGSSIGGCLCGNELWQSPESWERAKQNTSSDIYSLAIVSIYVMLDDMILHAGEAELSGDIAWWHVLRRHISYFGDEEGFRGLLDHIGRESPFHECLIAVAADFDPERPRKPFALWHYVNPDFRDLIEKMARLDPKKRITAREALHHPWFQRGERAS
ncbi:kinase-like domain-containing protein [Chaetomium strumarium]|uniref:Kinase-like domain-containing protein n=1 Tax=Chaetomium strumarium TaxID=1170767 RepID=A0AAJ0H4F5_9PEZI|nr:kinase-like domain-containing protein [Chaetomium strumarium]